MRPTSLLLISALVLAMLCAGLSVASRRVLEGEVLRASAREQALPGRMLWVWERPEDMRGLDASSTGAAVLVETLRLGSVVKPMVRHQPLLLPVGTTRIAVVRIETDSAFAQKKDDAAFVGTAVGELVSVARAPGVAALQIDFDARKSERDFYRRLLTELRGRMPAEMPLEMTALVSWCSTDDWIADLPVNMAIPMFFRMEPDRRRLGIVTDAAYRIREPLCAGSVGVSTREPWPADVGGKRVYVFADRGWNVDGPVLPMLPQEAALRSGAVQP